jgi:hypothetical protein
MPGATHLGWVAAYALIILVRVDQQSIEALKLALSTPSAMAGASKNRCTGSLCCNSRQCDCLGREQGHLSLPQLPPNVQGTKTAAGSLSGHSLEWKSPLPSAFMSVLRSYFNYPHLTIAGHFPIFSNWKARLLAPRRQNCSAESDSTSCARPAPAASEAFFL